MRLAHISTKTVALRISRIASAHYDDGNDVSVGGEWNTWPALEVIAVSASYSLSNLTGSILLKMISKLKSDNHPLRGLMVSRDKLDRVGVDEMLELKKLVKI